MIRKLSEEDIEDIHEIINMAATADKGHIPDDCYQEPYMQLWELRREMSRMTIYGWEEKGKLVAVAGYQPLEDVTLMRHVYVLPECQHRGIGTRLCNYIKRRTRTRRLLVGAWAGASWAISFYKKLGFRMMRDKNRLLDTYWHIPARQRDMSVVLGIMLEPQVK
jgi:N-acetylglutamate synthase-like GNAT family acetyltransferase